MMSEPSARLARTEAEELAPSWHTAVLVFLILAVAITGTWLQLSGASGASAEGARGLPESRIWSQYLPLLLVNWGLVAYVARLFRTHNALPDLLGRGWDGARQFLSDLGLAAAVFAFVELVEQLTVRAFGAGRNAALPTLLPSTGAERLTWLVVAVSVGFCEEVVYRGYLQRQLSALSGRAEVGIVLSAILFGIAHAEQGFGPAVRIAGYGLVLGILARFRRSLLPGILCHVAIDLTAAF